MKKLLLLLGIVLLVSAEISAQITMAEARTAGAGSTVTVKGIVTNGSELGLIRYLQDETGGIAAYSSSMSSVVRGDEVTVTGTLKNYNNLLEFDPVTSFTVNSSENELPAGVVVTPSQLAEAYEGMLVTIDAAVFTLAGQTFASKTNYIFTANGEQGQIRINDAACPLIGTVIPSGEVNITGVLSQYYDTWQILVRDGDDLVPGSAINFTTPVSVSNLSQSGFTLTWDTDVDGTTEAFYGMTSELELGKLSGTGGVTAHELAISGANPSDVFYVQPFSVSGEDTAKALIGVYTTVSASSGEIRSYFNRSVDNSLSLVEIARQADHGIDDTLINYINRAKYSIDFTMYNFNNDGISNVTAALNNAHNRGVNVRVVYDANTDCVGVDGLDAGIGKKISPVSAYPVYGIMHNKFIVFDAYSADADDPIVWTGSTNLTDGQVNTDPNSVIIIQDQSLAKAYTLEFNEMFGSDGLTPNGTVSKFGPDKIDNTPHQFLINGKEVECYFSPSDRTNEKILKTINSADEELYIATMLITKTDLGYAIRDRKSAGVDAKVIVNAESGNAETVNTTLMNSLIANFRETGESGIMHHKYMIVDQGNSSSDPMLLVGSHNWSSSADLRNDENTLIIHDQTIANVYYQEFSNRFAAGQLIVDAPICTNDYVSMTTGVSVNKNVLENDEIPSEVTVTIASGPSHGQAVVETDNSITYTPDPGFNAKLDTIVYQATLNSNSSLFDTAELVVFVNLPVGVKNLKTNELTVYPMPSKGELHVAIGEDFGTVKMFSVFDMTGKSILNQKSAFFGAGEQVLDLSAYPNGLYILRMEKENGDVVFRKIILEK